MKKLSSQLTFSHARSVARVLGLDLIEANIGFELWAGESYQGGFVSLDAAINEIKLRQEITEIKHAEAAADSNKISSILVGATEAALIYNGDVIGYCKTIIKNGGYITIAREMTNDTAPVNTMQVKISRSEKNIKKIQEAELYIPRLYNGDVFYVK
ncbi:hypothetical protein V2A84_00135 [Yersinia sp. 2553 StPb PI]|uniref:hypothetical protein n=1 Tax=Yersinia sp. 2553 StPb PI TaxID=3117411 RepID=UPI003FA4BFDE